MKVLFSVTFRTPVKISGRALALDRAVGPKREFYTFSEAQHFIEQHMHVARASGACRAAVMRGSEEFAEYFDSSWFVYGEE